MTLTWFGATLMCIAVAGAQPRAIDTEKSTMTVRVFKAGVLSAFGHDHEISAPIDSGAVDVNARRVELHVKAAAMKVQDPKASDKERAEIQSNMVGAQVLDVERFPEIAFQSTGVEPSGSGAWMVHGTLSLHGQSHAVDVEVKEAGGKYTGSAKVKQSDFGIKPIKAAGGTVKVKDEVRIEFDISLK